MSHILRTIVRIKSFKAVILTALVVLLYTSVNAQMYSATDAPSRNKGGLTYGGSSGGSGGSGDKSWGLSLSAGYDVPTGDMSSTFKAAPTFSFGYLNNYNNFTFNATIGYVSYKPKFDTAYFVGNDPTQGYLQYGNFSSLEVYTGAAYNIPISDNAKFYFGFDLGTYVNFFNYSLNDGQGNTYNYNTTYEQDFIAPKLGVDFMVSDNLSIGLQAKYNFILSAPQNYNLANDDYDSDYTPLAYKTFSGHVTLTYHF
jgi:hypothetical protein